MDIKTVTSRASRRPTRQGPHVRVHFDGGLGTVGWVAYDVSGVPCHAFGHADDVTYHTHNIAEVEAARRAMDFLASDAGLSWLAKQDNLSHIVLVGDSDLVIKFLQRAYSPQRPLFFTAVRHMWATAKLLPFPVEYLHVKRAHNTFADYMGRLARALGRIVSLCDVPTDVFNLHSSPAPAGGHFFAIPVARSDVELAQLPCAVCGGAGAPEATLICDLCGQPRHVQCAGL